MESFIGIIMKIQNIRNIQNIKTSPLIFNNKYDDNLKKIVAYKILKPENNDTYDSISEFIITNYESLDKPFHNYHNIPHAYGIFNNLIRSKIASIDIDTPDENIINNNIEILKQYSNIDRIDIAISSRNNNNSILGWHIHAGFKSSINIESIFNNNKIIMCEKYRNMALKQKYTVIRISKKFNDTLYNKTKLKWHSAHIKDGKIWKTLSSEQLIAPLIIAAGQYGKELLKNYTVNLRV